MTPPSSNAPSACPSARSAASALSRVLSLAALLAAGRVGSAAEPVEARLDLIAEEATRTLGGYAPQRLSLQPTAPPALSKAPEGLDPTDTRYGTLAFGPAGATTAFLLITREPTHGPARIWIDANANGDLTDDPAVTWTPAAYKSRTGESYSMHSGGARLTARHEGRELSVRVQFYRFDPRDTARAALKDTLLYYGDYARRGTIQLAERTVPALLADDRTTGDFRGTSGAPEGSGVRLSLDLDGNGAFDRRPWESFDIRKPFKVLGQVWEVRDMSWNGDSFRLARSSAAVDEVTPPPSTEVGKPFPAFTAKTLSGREVAFPSAYKGQLVLLDFWATWCGPCIAELPNLKAAYAEFKDRGVAVLGVSLDEDSSREKIEAFLKKQGIEWDQVYEGGGWKTRLAQKYGIDSIPRVFLVDGDSGRVLAQTRELRGPALHDTLRKALAERQPAAAK